MDRIRIMHVIGQLTVGGCEKQLLGLCERMDRKRFDLSVCWYSRLPGELSGEFAAAGVKLVNLDKFEMPLWKFFFRLRRAIREIRPDIVHTWLYSANAWGRWAALAARVPCIIASERTEVRGSGRFYRISERLLARSSTLLVNSQSVARSLERHYGVPFDRIHVIYNAVGLPPCDPIACRASVRQELGLAADARLVLMVGRLHASKNWPMFVRVAERVCRERQDTCFVGLGIGPLRDELEGMVLSKGLQGRVRFLGERRDVPRWLAAADLFCFTSNWEGFPNAPLEAMLAGLPVVCTRFDSIGELLTDPAAGCLVPLEDDRAMAGEVVSLLDDPPRRRAMIAAGQAMVRTRHDWDCLVKTMQEFYEATLAARTGRQ